MSESHQLGTEVEQRQINEQHNENIIKSCYKLGVHSLGHVRVYWAGWMLTIAESLGFRGDKN